MTCYDQKITRHLQAHTNHLQSQHGRFGIIRPARKDPDFEMQAIKLGSINKNISIGKIMIVRIIALLLLISSSLVYAKGAGQGTPDNKTPARETVCDVTKDATPGLYGLCVSFCEAQDFSLDQLEAGLSDADVKKLDVARNLLAKYNAKKAENDPDMPCARQDDGGGDGGDGDGNIECPCWVQSEFDQFLSGEGYLYCIYGGGGIRSSVRMLNFETNERLKHASAGLTGNKGTTPYCGFSNVAQGIERIYSGITAPEAALCKQHVDEFITYHQQTDGLVEPCDEF